VALVTRRDRVQHVYCKRTNETVPCVAIRLADDTFDGLRVVLWRAHAAADVGAERRERRCSIVGTLPLFAPETSPVALDDSASRVSARETHQRSMKKL
jgi:hypothetical protein